MLSPGAFRHSLQCPLNVCPIRCRFEFLEILVRSAFGKFITPKLETDASDSVTRLLDEVIIPRLQPGACLDPNVFRRWVGRGFDEQQPSSIGCLGLLAGAFT